MEYNDTMEGNNMSQQHDESSRAAGHDDKNHKSEGPTSHTYMTFEGDDANSTIYHVPSFLLKTYEIVDVSSRLLFWTKW